MTPFGKLRMTFLPAHAVSLPIIFIIRFIPRYLRVPRSFAAAMTFLCAWSDRQSDIIAGSSE
jgi:hypothetical protein